MAIQQFIGRGAVNAVNRWLTQNQPGGVVPPQQPGQFGQMPAAQLSELMRMRRGIGQFRMPTQPLPPNTVSRMQQNYGAILGTMPPTGTIPSQYITGYEGTTRQMPAPNTPTITPSARPGFVPPASGEWHDTEIYTVRPPTAPGGAPRLVTFDQPPASGERHDTEIYTVRPPVTANPIPGYIPGQTPLQRQYPYAPQQKITGWRRY